MDDDIPWFSLLRGVLSLPDDLDDEMMSNRLRLDNSGSKCRLLSRFEAPKLTNPLIEVPPLPTRSLQQ